jgi:hypothetical protein
MNIRKVISFTAVLYVLTFGFAWGEENWQKNLYLSTFSATGADGGLNANNQCVLLDSGLDDFGGALGFSAMKNQWGFYVEVSALSLKEETPSSTDVLKTTVRHSTAEAGAVYRLTQGVDLLAGIRHQGIGLKLKTSDGATPDDSTGFLDAFAGAKIGRFAATDRWLCWAEGDIGTGASDLVWNLRFETGYRFTENCYVAASFRYLDTDFEGDDIRYDGAIRTMGLVVGYSF